MCEIALSGVEKYSAFGRQSLCLPNLLLGLPDPESRWRLRPKPHHPLQTISGSAPAYGHQTLLPNCLVDMRICCIVCCFVIYHHWGGAMLLCMTFLSLNMQSVPFVHVLFVRSWLATN